MNWLSESFNDSPKESGCVQSCMVFMNEWYPDSLIKAVDTRFVSKRICVFDGNRLNEWPLHFQWLTYGTKKTVTCSHLHTYKISPSFFGYRLWFSPLCCWQCCSYLQWAGYIQQFVCYYYVSIRVVPSLPLYSVNHEQAQHLFLMTSCLLPQCWLKSAGTYCQYKH